MRRTLTLERPGLRTTVVQLVFRERGVLRAAYIPLLANGGLFVPSTCDYKLGDDIYGSTSTAQLTNLVGRSA